LLALATQDASIVNARRACIAAARNLFATLTNELVAPLSIENRTLCDHGTSFAASRLRHSQNQIN
jgi:hypothetical protein